MDDWSMCNIPFETEVISDILRVERVDAAVERHNWNTKLPLWFLAERNKLTSSSDQVSI